MRIIGGMGIAGFKSFGPDPQYLNGFDKINILVGKNNSGKSNVLSFLSTQLTKLNPGFANPSAAHKFDLKDLEICRSLGEEAAQFAVGVHLTDDKFRRVNTSNSLHPNVADIVPRYRRAFGFGEDESLSWLHFQFDPIQKTIVLAPFVEANFLEEFNDEDLDHLTFAYFGRRGGTTTEKANMIISQINPFAEFRFPEVEFIPAIREIRGDRQSDEHDHSGMGLIQELAVLERPRAEKSDDKARFEKVNEFVRQVTGTPDASIEIPHDRSTINISMDGRYLPLASVGTGIHEIIILASKCTVFSQKIVCIEEPEIHVHPVIQRKFLRYIFENTDNQYFIATHSAHFLETVKSTLFHVRLKDSYSVISTVQTNNEKSNICQDLGYRPSDLIQSNCIIWVEGPSDRIYLSHWISIVDENLIEGIHYSIMFYGGRLLNHLSVSDVLISEFIQLRKLNRFVALVMDSDKSNKTTPLNSTKRRIRREFSLDGGYVWVTQGREIENYVDRKSLAEAIDAVSEGATIRHGRYNRVYNYRDRNGSLVSQPDKLRIAREVIKRQSELTELDLQRKVRRLTEFIRRANAEA